MREISDFVKVTIYIKNMVCGRCKMVVSSIFKDLSLHPVSIELGSVGIKEERLTKAQEEHLSKALIDAGFELLSDKNSKIIQQIKNIITEIVQEKSVELNTTLSSLIEKELNQDYSSCSHLFSSVEGVTIEKYFILQRIEKVKELLTYDELTISEIAHELDYSSSAHLSSQFKKVTGLTPSEFKRDRPIKRKSLDSL